MVREIFVPSSEEPKTLENFLKKHFPIGYVRKLFRKNGVRLNGKRCGAKVMIKSGDRLDLFIPFEARPKGPADRQIRQDSLPILFENDDFLVIDKKAGIAVQEGKGLPKRHTLDGFLEARFRDRPQPPRLVHRIDRETSGLLIVAKSGAVAEDIEKLFAEGLVEKEYLALIVGHPKRPSGSISHPLPGRTGSPVSALTLYRTEKKFTETTLVRAKTKTGRMHQIRLHFKQMGHPVVMDRDHGDFSFNKRFQKAYGLKRLFLHASGIAFSFRGRNWKWTAPLPADLEQTLRLLEGNRRD